LIRKAGKLEPASWDEALDLITDKFKEIKTAHGPNALAFYGSGQCSADESYVYNKLFKGFIGTNNVEGNPRTCMASAVAGYISTFGKDEPEGNYEDIEAADVFFFIGSNAAEAHPILWSRVMVRKANNPKTKIIVADPRNTITSDSADLVLNFKPGTDLALLNGMAHVIIKEGLIDKGFIEKHTNFMQGDDKKNWDDYVEFLEDYTPEKVANITGVSADDIVMAAKIFADKNLETMSLWCMGINQRIRGTWANNLIHNLHLITGKICRPGSTNFSLTGQPSACGSVREVGALSHLLPAHRSVANEKHRQEIAAIWGCDPTNIQAQNGKPMMDMFQGTVDGSIKGLWVMCTNPGQSLPNVNKYREGMEKCFLVVSEGYHPTRTTELADVVLPASVWCEKEGFYGNAERRGQHMAKAVEPPEGVKDDVWALLQVASRMGYGQHFQYKSIDDIWNEYRKCAEGTGMDLGTIDEYRNSRGLKWPVINGKESQRRYVYPYDPYVTKEEGIKFYGKPDGRATIWLRPMADPAELPDNQYPFYFTTGRLLEQWHTMTMTGTVPQLNNISEVQSGEEGWFIEVNPLDAKALNLKDGDKVKIESRRGSINTKVKLDGRGTPQPGLLYMNFHDDNLTTMANILVSDAFDQVSRQPEYKISAVKIAKL
ncbi:MAG: nitrate reductase, partial [Bacillota bacterium]|nr:nitrate reductase [Bacillota bacterium]